MPVRLLDLEEMPDESGLWIFVASRSLTTTEQSSILRLSDNYLRWWSEASGHLASSSRMLFNGQVLAWAVLLGNGVDHLTGDDLDSFFDARDRFAANAAPPFSMRSNEAAIVDNCLILDPREWIHLMRSGKITPQSDILHGCSVGEWRAGRLIHSLGSDAVWFEALKSAVESSDVQ